MDKQPAEPPILDPKYAIAEIMELRDRTTRLAQELGKIGFKSWPEVVEFRKPASELLAAATSLDSVAASVEPTLPFGEIDSYFEVFRFFCDGDHLGRVYTVEQILEHLRSRFNMEGETPDTLADTLLDWADDIMHDAADPADPEGLNDPTRARIQGEFQIIDGGFTFSPLSGRGTQGSTIAAKQPQVPVEPVEPRREPKEVPTITQEVSRPTPETKFAGRLYNFIYNKLAEHGDTRQADIKKAAIKVNGKLTTELLQELIDEFIVCGRLFKYSQGGVAFLSLEKKDSIPRANSEAEKERDDDLIQPLDVDLAANMLNIFCAPGTHWQQRRDAKTIWRTLHPNEERPPTAQEEKDIRTAGRIMEKRYKLLTTGQERIGTGGRANTNGASSAPRRRRSASNTIFRMGLASQDIKNQIQQKLRQTDIEGIRDLFDSEPGE